MSVAQGADDSLWDRSKVAFPSLKEVQLPDVERIELNNGMVLYLLEDSEFPTVRGNLLVRVGSWLDPAEKVGLAEMTGTVLRTGGSARFPGDDLDRRLEGIGASVEFGIGQTSGTGRFWCLKENSAEVLEVFADLIRNPSFPEEKIELAKVALRRAIAGRNDEPMDILIREMGRLIWGMDHPYSRIPEYATVEAVTRDDMLEFHQQNYQPDRIYLTIVGDFKKKEMRKEIERLFGNWPAASSPAPVPPVAAKIVPGGGLAYAEKKSTTNTWVVMGHVGLRADNPDYAAMNVLGEILGGGFSSRLFNEIRSKRGLAYAAGSSSGTDIARPGVFIGYAGTRSDSALVVLDLIREEIRRVTKEPVTEDELKLARDGILNSYVFQYASKDRIANRMAFLNFHGYPDDFTSSYPEQVKALVADDLLQAAKRNIHPDDLQVLLVGNKEDFAEPLESRGSYTTVDLTIPDPPTKRVIPSPTPESLAKGTELLHRAATAMGGVDGWTSVREIEKESEIAASIQGMQLTIHVHSVDTADGRHYVSQVLPFGEMIMVLDGKTGWKKTPGGVEDLSAAEIEEMVADDSREFWTLFRNIDALEAQAIASEQIGDVMADAIVLRGEGLKELLVYLDPESGEPIARRYPAKAPMTGDPVEATEIYGDYRATGPISVPYAVEILYDGEHFASGKVTRAAVNQGVDEGLFAKP